MEAALLFILNNSISSVWVVLAVVLLRLLLRWAPKRIVRILWVLPALRLMLPFSIESVVSLIPDRVRLSQEVLTAVVPEVNNRLLIVDNSLNPVLQMSSVSGTAASVNPMQGFIYWRSCMAYWTCHNAASGAYQHSQTSPQACRSCA